MKKFSQVLVVVSVFASVAHADSYQYNVARAAGELNCQFSKSNGGTSQCTTDSSTQGTLPITMTAKQDGNGYVGVDQITEGDTQYLLVLESDSLKNLRSVSTMSLKASNDSIDGTISASEATSLAVVNISPLHIEAANNDTVQIKVGYFAYASATGSNMVTARDHRDLTQYILGKTQPALSAILR